CTWPTSCSATRRSSSFASFPSTCARTRAKTSRAMSVVSCASGGSPTRSVSTGTPPVWEPVPGAPTEFLRRSASARLKTSLSSATSLLRGGDRVHVDIVAALFVERVAAPCAGLVVLVGGDDLEQALERGEERRPFGAEVEQHVAVRQVLAVGGEDHRRLGREAGARPAVRHEARGLERPEVAVE